MNTDLCAKCGKPFKSVKHAGHRTGSHEFVTPTELEAKFLWSGVLVEAERGKGNFRPGQVVEVNEPNPGQIQFRVKVVRNGLVWRDEHEVEFTN